MTRFILSMILLLALNACGAPAATSAPTLPEGQPTSATSGEANPTKPALAAAANGVHPGAVVVDDSYVTVYGEFENTGQRWLHNIQVIVTYYDAAGAEIYVDKVPTEILFAGPGERVPFYVVTSKERMQGSYASHKIEVTSTENDQPASLLAVTFTDEGVIGGIGEISGTVKHSGQGTCGYPVVAVAYYDSAGKVLAVSSNYLDTLTPGQEAPYKLVTMNLPAEYGQVAAWAACREIDGTPVP